MIGQQRDLFAGEELKEKGQKRVEGNNAGFVREMRAQAERICSVKGSVTSDDLREYARIRGMVPDHPNAWGSIFRGKRWVRVGYRKSEIASNHARTIAVWTLKPKP